MIKNDASWHVCAASGLACVQAVDDEDLPEGIICVSAVLGP